MKPSEKIMEIAREACKQQYMKENPYAAGWEYIEDQVAIKFALSGDRFVIFAILKYLDESLTQQEKQ